MNFGDDSNPMPPWPERFVDKLKVAMLIVAVNVFVFAVRLVGGDFSNQKEQGR